MYETDCEETFAIIANMDTIRDFIVVVVVKGWNLHHMDVKNAFLHGDLQEEVFVE